LKRFLLALLLCASSVHAAPQITSVSGVIGNGNSLTIVGTGFGTKGVAAPVKFDTFEGGTLGQNIGNGWTLSKNGAGTNHGLYPIYSSSVTRTNSTRSAQARFDNLLNCGDEGCNYSSNFGIASVPAPGLPVLYIDTWVNYAPATPESRNVKLLRIHADFASTQQPNQYLNIYCFQDTDGARLGSDGGGTPLLLPASPWRGSVFFANHWRHIQAYMAQSSPGVADGTEILTIDDTTSINRSANVQTRADSRYWDTVFFGNFVAHYGISSCPQNTLNPTYTYWEDTYVDTTRAHVEIGNDSAYVNCTQREIQPATFWKSSGDSIKITANQGAFASLTGKYVYVIDRNGSVSNKFKLNTNVAPVLATPTSMTVNENATADQSLSATDQDGQSLTFSKQSGPTYMTVTTTAGGTGTATGNIHLAPGYTDAGSVSTTVRVSDGSLTNDQTMLVTVSDVPRSPSLTQPSNQTMNEGAQTDVALSATDADLDPLFFSLVSGPSFAAVTTTDPGSGTATGNIHLAPNFRDSGTYSVVTQATDPGLLTDQKTITVTVNNVNRAPHMTLLRYFYSPMSNYVGHAPISQYLADCVDLDGDTITFTKLDEGTALFGTFTVTKISNARVGCTFGPVSPDDDARAKTYVTQGVQASDGTDHEDQVFNIYFGDPNTPF